MRLSSVLSEHESNNKEIESFINTDLYTDELDSDNDEREIISSGSVIDIKIGKIRLPFYCSSLRDNVNFQTSDELHCLIINPNMVSIDCLLDCADEEKQCTECKKSMQAWFLVEANDIFSNTPKVKILKRNFRLLENIKLPIEIECAYKKLLEKAEMAYKERLGIGSIIYLRTIFEKITHNIGHNADVAINKPNGKPKPFNQILEAVNNEYEIIPKEFSDKGYEIFKILSEIAHGHSDEDEALEQYPSLNRLVISVLDNVKKKEEEIKNSSEIQKALKALGMDDEGGEGNE